MLKVKYTPFPGMLVEVEGRDLAEIFKELGPVQEVLHNDTCGKCGGKRIRLVHRLADGKHDVYELMCETPGNNKIPCGAKLSLGKSSEGNLFPRRYEQEKGSDNKWKKKVVDGKTVYLPNKGWVRWDAAQNKNV